MTEKTHWLQNPNKNYLGHWDLPDGKDIVLTIVSAQWEEVKNPITRSSEARRVIRWEEQGIKPFICNETNAQTILRSTGTKFMEDSLGMRVKLGLGKTKVAGQEVDCLRVRDVASSSLRKEQKKLSEEQAEKLLALIAQSDIDNIQFCELMNINSVADLPANKWEAVCTRLTQKIKEMQYVGTDA